MACDLWLNCKEARLFSWKEDVDSLFEGHGVGSLRMREASESQIYLIYVYQR